jgi:acetylornithine deacetylase/succinyl-diaminopimelate desuccinylase-like protein
VGTISGGTSVNTIAQEAQMLYEYRSDSKNCLAQMEAAFLETVRNAERNGVQLRVDKIGDRPCAGAVDLQRQQALLHRAAAAVRLVTGQEPVFRSGSTDCNAALGAGVPAVCFGGCVGGGCHTREEYLELASLEQGCRLVMTFLQDYFRSE